MISVAVFISESRLKVTKGIAIGILIGSYQAGVLLAGVIAGWAEWEYAFAVLIVPLFIAAGVMKCFSEPSRNQREDRNQGDPVPIFLNLKALILGSLVFGSLLIGYWASLSWIPVWIEGFQTLGKEKALATTVHGLMAVIGCFTAGIFCDRWGRCKMMKLGFLGAFSTSWIMFFGHSVFHPLIYVENGLLGFFIGGLQSVLYIYLPELFPQAIRGTSVALCLNVGRAVTVLALFFVSSLVAGLGGLGGVLSVFALFYLFGAVTACFAPETCKSS